MRRFFVISLPIAVIALFIFVMHTDRYLKYPLGRGDNVPASIQAVIDKVKSEKWSEAEKDTGLLSQSWRKVVLRVQFSAEKDEIDGMDMSIARLRGAISAKDKASALIELHQAFEHWENIGK